MVARMINAFVDPFALACPSEEDGREHLERYLTSLLEWRDLAETECLSTYGTATAAQVLTTTGGFPPWQRVRTLIERFGMAEELGPQDVFNVLQRFTDRMPTIEESLGVDDLLLDNVQCVPASYKARAAAFADEFERLLALISLLVELRGLPVSQQMVITRDLARCPEQLQFKAVVLDAEGPSAAEIAIPKDVAGGLGAYGCSAQLKLAVDPLQLWEQGCYRFAVELFTGRQAVAASVNAIPRWSLGAHFADSVEGLNVTGRAIGQSILRACAKTVLSQDMAAVHAIRVSAAANADQRKRGQDSAWRRDVDHEYHLHYWNTSAGPELAVLAAHKDLGIPE